MRLSSAKYLIIGVEIILLLIVLSILAIQELTSTLTYAPIVHLEEGAIRGLTITVEEIPHQIKVHFYQGIRYGRAERFRAPFPAESWPGIYQAIEPRAACPFNGLDNPAKRYTTKMYSEDCLFLNVWRPLYEHRDGKTGQLIPFPVMVYIFGGGFTGGSIFKFTHDGRYIAGRGDVIVVAMNYRISSFGFLYGDSEAAPGNAGFHDQILALKWVQRNIARFGGDPNKVTIFGNSAGSTSVGSLLLSPLTKGLFKRAILQSGVPNSLADKNEALEATRKLAKAANCPTVHSNGTAVKMSTTLTCLKLIHIETLLNASKVSGEPNKPMYGESVHPIEPVKALNNGQFYSNGIDLMFGVVKDEGPSFASDVIQLENQTFTVESTRESITTLFKRVGLDENFVKEIADFYTANLSSTASQDDLRNLIGTSYGDYFMTCPVVLFGESFARVAFTKSVTPTANKYYAWRLMKRAGVHVMGICDEPWMGVCHADDLFYLFSIPDQKTVEEDQLSRDMIKAWANFARHGNPGVMGSGRGGKGGVQWEEAFGQSFTLNSTKLEDKFVTSHMTLDPLNYTMVDAFWKQSCDYFWRERIFI